MGHFPVFPVHTKRIIRIRFRTKRIRVDGALKLRAVDGTRKRCFRSSHSPSLSKPKLKRPIAGYVWPHSPILIVSFFIAGDSFTRIKRAFVESEVKHFCWVGLGYIENRYYNETSPLGHLHLGDTKFGRGEYVHIIFVFVTSIKGTPIQGEGTLFLGPKN